MAVVTHIHVRDARDRLTELLGIGQPYPLRDLAVRDEQLTVTFNSTAKIPIEDTQVGVLYQLYDDHELVERTEEWEKGSGIPIEAEGNGGTLMLETYKIRDDITFQILATKQKSGLQAYLHETATVKVGLDTKLRAWIRDAALLDPAITNPTDTMPRIVDYGASVTVEVEKSQEGVDYKLVYFKDPSNRRTETGLSVNDVRGDLHNIILTTKPVYEDLEIHIRATKTFDPSENRPTQTALLEVVLPLKVRANPALAVSVTPAPIIGYQETAQIKIAKTQSSARYRIFIRPIMDGDFVRRNMQESEVIKVGVDNEPDVAVRKPPRGQMWELPEGFVESGDAQAGNDGDLVFDIPALTLDSLVIVQAWKDHQADVVIPSAVQLEQAVVVLARPDPAPPLWLRVVMDGEKTNGDLYAFDGQAGVFYAFRLAADSDDLGLPAYFHRRDERDEILNKGVDQLALEVDFVIARSRAATPAGEPADLAQIPPENPIVDTGPLDADTTLHVLARKAQTRVPVLLNQTASIRAVPVIHLEDTIVNYGATTRILVIASVNGERYEPYLNGAVLRRARLGNGDDLSFNTDVLTEGTRFEMLITQPEGAGIPVERVVPLLVRVRPNINLAVSPTSAVVDYSDSAAIRVEASQPLVRYQLMAEDNPIGSAVAGSGETITLSTDSLTENITLVIQALKAGDPEIVVELAQQVTITVRPNARLRVAAAAATVDHNTGTDIQIENSQSGVRYQLMAGGEAVGDPVSGSGQTIALPTGALTENTTFVIRASQTANPDIFVDLAQQITITVRPEVPSP